MLRKFVKLIMCTALIFPQSPFACSVNDGTSSDNDTSHKSAKTFPDLIQKCINNPRQKDLPFWFISVCLLQGNGVKKNKALAQCVRQLSIDCEEPVCILFDEHTDAIFKKGFKRFIKNLVTIYSQIDSNKLGFLQNGIGLMHYKGNGIEQNESKAVEWFTKSATLGYENAQFALGLCYASGTGCTKNSKAAVEWLRRAANQGNQGAIIRLACLQKQTSD